MIMNNTKQHKGVICEYLSANIRYLRKQKKLSQDEFAQLIGLNRGNIASYENGTAEPKICNLLKMAEFFGVPLAFFTRQDLTDKTALHSLSRLRGMCPQEKAKLENLHARSAEFKNFLDGIYACYNYKAKKIDELENLPKEAQFLKSHFEQLHQAATELHEEHQKLLKMCHTKDPG